MRRELNDRGGAAPMPRTIIDWTVMLGRAAR